MEKVVTVTISKSSTPDVLKEARKFKLTPAELVQQVVDQHLERKRMMTPAAVAKRLKAFRAAQKHLRPLAKRLNIRSDEDVYRLFGQ